MDAAIARQPSPWNGRRALCRSGETGQATVPSFTARAAPNDSPLQLRPRAPCRRSRRPAAQASRQRRGAGSCLSAQPQRARRRSWRWTSASFCRFGLAGRRSKSDAGCAARRVRQAQAARRGARAASEVGRCTRSSARLLGNAEGLARRCTLDTSRKDQQLSECTRSPSGRPSRALVARLPPSEIGKQLPAPAPRR